MRFWNILLRISRHCPCAPVAFAGLPNALTTIGKILFRNLKSGDFAAEDFARTSYKMTVCISIQLACIGVW